MKTKLVLVLVILSLSAILPIASTHLKAESQRKRSTMRFTGSNIKVPFYEESLRTRNVTLKFDGIGAKPVTIALVKECQISITSLSSNGMIQGTVDFDPETQKPDEGRKTFSGGLRVGVEISGQRCLDVTAEEMTIEYSPKSNAN